MRHVRLALFSILLGLSWPGIGQACTCAPFIGRGPVDAVVVSGTVEADVDGGETSPWWGYSSRLVAETVWFGPDQRVFRLIGPYARATTCGGPFIGQPGEKVIVWLYPFNKDYFRSGGCSVIDWKDKDREAIEASLRRQRARYSDVDRQLLARPDDAALWRARLKIATDLKDRHGRLRSLKRLVELTPVPDLELLKDAATTADAVHDGEAAARFADRGLTLSPGDDALKAIRHRTILRQRYDATSLTTTKELDGVRWTDLREENARIDLVQLRDFQIQRSTFGGLIQQAQLFSGTIRDTTFTRLIMRDSQVAGVLMRNVRMNGARLSGVKFELGKIELGDFTQATLDDTSFESTDIADTTFSGARMTKVQIGGLLTRVDFKQARLSDVAFYGRLTDIDFTEVSLERVRFHHVSLNNVDLSRASNVDIRDLVVDCRTKLPAGFDLAKAGGIVDAPQCDGQPNNRDFTSEAYATRSMWGGLDLTGANFAGLHLPHVWFSRSTLRGANFSGARFGFFSGYEADFRDARFVGANFANKPGSNADFRLADLRGTDFSGAVMSDARYAFSGAKYDARTKWPATFTDYAGKSYPFDPVALGAILVKD